MGETRKRADGVRRRFGQGLVVAAAITTGGWARANVITVTSFTDVAGDQKCGLMEAIFASVSHAQSDACNAGSGNDTIQLDTGTYTLLNYESVEIWTTQVTIQGKGMGNTIIVSPSMT